MLSQKIRQEVLAIRSLGTRQYVIARQAKLHPSVLSALLNSAIPVKPGDARIVRLGQVLGISPAECFEEEARG